MTAVRTVSDDLEITTQYFPRGRELAGIAVFWVVFAVLSTTNWLFPPGGDSPPITLRAIGLGLVDPLLWALVTPFIFWFTSRYDIEHERRAKRIVMYALIGIAVALGIDLIVEGIRTAFFAAPPIPMRGPPRPPRFWRFVRSRYLNDLVMVLAVMTAGVARSFFGRYQRRLEEAAALRAQLAEARLSALQSQLNPHFLFNTLNAVSSLVDSDPRGVRRIIARLSELLRATLEPTTEPELPLAREIGLLERYLEILRIRFQGRLETSVDVPPALTTALVPPLILQPIVENAMKHAVSRTTLPSRIDVRAARQDETLVLQVCDTGPGEETRDSPPAPSTGIGLRNTRARLEQLYGDDHSLAFDLLPNGGTRVTIRIPYHTSEDLRAVPSGDAS